MFRSILMLAAAGMSLLSGSLSAREIVLTNDDGLTSNVVAVYKALKAAGHDVVVAVPCTNQSGMSAAIRFSRPIGALTADCRNGAAKAGAPGAGAMTREGLGPDFFYVDGTPAMAMLYGVDVVGARRWGHDPDLVLSGPNEGQNLGAIVIASGTVGNAETAVLRGIPAVALSAGAGTTGTPTDPLGNPASAPIGALTAKLVAALDASAKGRPLLPAGLALNVNYPDKPEGARWRLTRVGTWNAHKVRFVESLSKDATPLMRQAAQARGVSLPDQPGVALSANEVAPTPEQRDDEAVANKSDITVSPLQAGYGAADGQQVAARLAGLFKK
ncbi:5'/3'-nucleotidase SurE [Novosphingobium sp. 9U]|uniref:5'/3'-nucleotidase SurE n=1 Tax=Novosphingobium sp. 9U TaxID=2653158 RepID=UPI0012F46110|nr:5'/3'-nucleotidase SurE [Novosphingobium sp. 9U]VWX53641.1 5'-nucleotidase surE [Novosphingobium sp. 9U]